MVHLEILNPMKAESTKMLIYFHLASQPSMWYYLKIEQKQLCCFSYKE